MITLEQTIEHCKQISDTCDITDTAEQYSQLAIWLDELRKYKQNSFIELEMYYNEAYNKTQSISLRKNEILQFYEATTILNVPCVKIITNHLIFKANIKYKELKEKLGIL